MSWTIEQEYGHLHICTLLDFYGNLLSARQKEIMGLFYYEDLSLFEISQLKNISRQAANSIIHRAVDKLKDIDQALGLMQNYQQNKVLRSELKRAIELQDWLKVTEVYKLWQEIEEARGESLDKDD